MKAVKRKTKSAEKCMIEGCEEHAVCLGLCGACYQAEWKWGKRSPSDRARRRAQLFKFQARLERLQAPRLRIVK